MVVCGSSSCAALQVPLAVGSTKMLGNLPRYSYGTRHATRHDPSVSLIECTVLLYFVLSESAELRCTVPYARTPTVSRYHGERHIGQLPSSDGKVFDHHVDPMRFMSLLKSVLNGCQARLKSCQW